MENKKSLGPLERNGEDKKYLELLRENESMVTELEEKQTLLKEAMEAIEFLEYQMRGYEEKCQTMMIEQQIQTFKLMKVGNTSESDFQLNEI
jgi:hypothetical protein